MRLGRWFTFMVAMSAHGLCVQAQTVPEVEESDVASLPPMSDHWGVTMNALGKGARIVDGDTGKLLGSLHTNPFASVAIDPQRRFFYVAETIWTKDNRGTRQDMISVYDARSLKLLHEITLPERLLTSFRKQIFDISADGRFAYVYNMSPAASVSIVDLVQRKVTRTLEIPGCALVFAAPKASFASLCGDGSLSTAHLDDKKKPNFVASSPFFAADDDPVFDNSIVDRDTGKAFFLNYSGLVFETTIGGDGKISAPWSLQEAAGMDRASVKPLAVSWLPGGRQLMAYHPATNRLFILMHLGEFWSQKEDGTELWVFDVTRHKLVARRTLSQPASYLEVTRDAMPLLLRSSQRMCSELR